MTSSIRIKKITAPITWPGGKACLLKAILPLIPPHKCYVEPFCGGAAVFRAKEKSEVEVLNDINGEIVGLYRVLKHHPDAFRRELSGAINSRQEFIDYRTQRGLTDIQRAARFAFRNALSFGGDCSSFGVVRTAGRGASTVVSRIITAAEAFHSRIQGVVIEHLDWVTCVELYDGPDTFCFIDPPYLDTQQRAYGSFTRQNFVQMKSVLKNLKGAWVLTTNDHPSLRALFRCFNIQPVSRTRGIRTQAQYKELIITPK